MPENVSAPVEFRSNQISRMFGVSLRQLQWWDERSLLNPRHEGQMRLYSEADAALVGIVSELRRKGLSLQRIRRMLRTIRSEVSRYVETGSTYPLFLLVRGPVCLFVETEPGALMDLIVNASGPIYAVSISVQVWKTREGEAERRERLRRARTPKAERSC